MSKYENICLPVNNSTQQAALSHETGIFTRANVARVCRRNACTNKFYAYICSARSTYRHCKRAGQEKIEGIGSSIIIRSYISGICGSCSFGLYRTAFLFNSSKCKTQMKQTTTAAGTTTVPASVKAGTIFSWSTLFAIVITLKNRLPEPWQDVIPVENVNDLKMVAKLSAILLAVFLMAGIYDMFLLQEGGTL